MDEGRKYSDKEVETLLARAVELSREVPTHDQGSGVSLAELEKTAIEAGLSVEALRRAAAELDAHKSSGRGLARRFFGLTAVRDERSIAGRPTETELSRLALDLPDIARTPGVPTVAEGCLIFRSDGGYEAQRGQRLRFEIRPLGGPPDSEGAQGAEPTEKEVGRVLLRVERTFESAAGGIYGGLVGGVGLGCGLGVGLGVGLGQLHSGVFAALFAAASLIVSFLAGRGLLSLIASDAKRRNESLLDEVEKRLSK